VLADAVKIVVYIWLKGACILFECFLVTIHIFPILELT
jgi:hypothetical protein